MKGFIFARSLLGTYSMSPGRRCRSSLRFPERSIFFKSSFRVCTHSLEIWLFRQISSEWVQTRKLDLKKMLRSGNLSEDLHLRPGDMLYVPKSDLAKMKPFIPLVTVGTYVPMH